MGSWPICPIYVPGLNSSWGHTYDTSSMNSDKRNCIVYSFGVANEWDFEHSMADLGCLVFAFDPTKEFREIHEKHSYPGVTFFYMGLGSEHTEKYGGRVENFNSELYGNVAGPIKSLKTIMKELNHSFIDVLKVDCEGCEWDAFGSASNDPDVLKNVAVFQLEVHFTVTLQVDSIGALRNMARFYDILLNNLNFRLWYEHDNFGHEKDREVHPILLELGAHPLVCCYELSFVNTLYLS